MPSYLDSKLPYNNREFDSHIQILYWRKIRYKIFIYPLILINSHSRTINTHTLNIFSSNIRAENQDCPQVSHILLLCPTATKSSEPTPKKKVPNKKNFILYLSTFNFKGCTARFLCKKNLNLIISTKMKRRKKLLLPLCIYIHIKLLLKFIKLFFRLHTCYPLYLLHLLLKTILWLYPYCNI